MLKEACKAKARDIAPSVQKESDLYKKKIAAFEEELKTYQVPVAFSLLKASLHGPVFLSWFDPNVSCLCVGCVFNASSEWLDTKWKKTSCSSLS